MGSTWLTRDEESVILHAVPSEAPPGPGLRRGRDDAPGSAMMPGRVLARAAPLVVLLSLAGSILVQSPLAGAGAIGGTAYITRPGSAAVLDSGDPSTSYGVLLPSGSSCPGDTAHDGYHVFSYLVPKGVSPASVSFKTGVPSRYYGFISAGTYIGAVNTALNTGEIVGLPSAFTFSRWTRSELIPAGASGATWEGGIACANIHGVATNYWSAQISFRVSTSGSGGYTWTVAQQAPGTLHPRSWIGPILIVLAAGFASMAIVMRRRHNRQHPRRPDQSRPLQSTDTPPPTVPTRVPELAEGS
jgi:hypothetical protein